MEDMFKKRKAEIISDFMAKRKKYGKDSVSENDLSFLMHCHELILQSRAFIDLLERGMIEASPTKNGSDFLIKAVAGSAEEAFKNIQH